MDGPNGNQYNIQSQGKKMVAPRSKSQIKGIPKKAFNNTSESMHVVGPFVNDYISKYGNGKAIEEDYASKTIAKKGHPEKKRRIAS